MTTAPATPDKKERIKTLAEDIAGLIRDNKAKAAIQKFQAESDDDRYAILMDGDACVLHWAVWDGRADAITALLSGLSPNQRVTAITVPDKFGSTPLHWAAWDGRAGAITALLAELSPEQHVTAIMAADADGNTPLYEAAYNGHVDAITAMLTGLNVTQCHDALLKKQHGAAIKLAQKYAENPQDADTRRYLNTLIKGVSALETSDGTDEQGLSENDKKGLITGIIQEVEKINSDAEIPSAAVPYLDIPKTVGGYLQGLQGSFAQAVTATTTDPANGNDNTPAAAVGEEKPVVATTPAPSGQ